MAQVTDQNVPPGLAALYAALVSPAKIEQGPDGVLRLKKGKKKTKRKPSSALDLAAWKRLAEIVATTWLETTGQELPPDSVYDLILSMIVGIYPFEYFKLCEVETSIRLLSVPACTPDPDPPPYGYRTPAFLPTICDYPEGTPDDGPLGTYGEKQSGYWHDRWLRWQREVFKADAFEFANPYERMALLWDATLSIAAAARGSRPMLSLNLKAQASPANSGPADSYEPPILKKSNLYWRFKIPPSEPPFYNSYQVRKVSQPIARLVKEQVAPFSNRIVINASPRPMMGRGFNNNDNAQITLEGLPALYEVRKCMGQTLETWHRANAVQQSQWYVSARSDIQGLWVVAALNDANGRIIRSSDGQVWTTHNTGQVAGWQAAEYVPDLALWVMVANTGSGSRCVTSPNGASWTARTMPAVRSWFTLAWSPTLSKLVAGAADIGSNNIAHSSNGINWSLATTPSGWRIQSVVWSPLLAIFLGVGNNNTNGQAYASSDGVTWSVISTLGNYSLNYVAWSPALKLFVAVTTGGAGPHVHASADGSLWESQTIPGISSLGRVRWIQDLSAFVIAVQQVAGSSTEGGYLMSHDGHQWELNILAPGTQPIDINFSQAECQGLIVDNYPGTRGVWISP